MPKADFNKEFPTRASLRRAREEQEAEREKADALKVAAGKSETTDVFDAVPESNRTQTQKPPAPKQGKQTANAADTANPVVANNAPLRKPAGDVNAATSGTAKTKESNKSVETKQPATPKPAVPGAAKSSTAKPAAPTASKTEAKQPTNAKPAPAVAAKPEAVKPAEAKPEAAKFAAAKPSTTPNAKAVAPTETKPAVAKPAPAKPAEASKTPAVATPATAKPAAAPAAKPAAPTAPAKTAPAKPAPAAAKATESPAPAANTASSETESAKPAPKAAEPAAKAVKAAEKPATTEKPAPAKTEPAKAAPAAVSKTPASKAPVANQSPELSLSTAEGRRQAFRELNPSAGERDTFLRPEDETSFRAERGFRGFLSRMGFAMEPSAQEVEERTWRRTIGTRLNEPKTISVVNGKGGANKTPTAVLLSAVFGRNSGDPVLVWDNNGTRGTLGWRTLKGSHTRHSMDLLAAAEQLKETRVGDPAINDYVHYQPEDCYSVLRTDPTLLASEQHVNAADFDVLHEIVSRFFSLTIVDSGNDESAERWLRMIDHTDQLVIASTTVEEHAEAGALLLEALAKRGGRYAELAKNAVVIISQHQPQGNDEQLNRIAHGFRRLARQVVTVPYDAALVKGQIRFDGLRPATRRAWLHATAAVAGALHN